MRRIAFAAMLWIGVTSSALCADQTILGTELALRNPGLANRRKVIVKATEPATDNVIVGDPAIIGATLTVTVNGTASSSQTYQLTMGTSAVTQRPFWTGDAVRGFTYRDSRGEHGAVAKVQLRVSRGSFRIRATIDGRAARVDLVPPHDGTDGCVLLAIAGGDSYSVKFADGRIVNVGATAFKIVKPTRQGTCIDIEAATTSTSTTTSSSSTGTSASTTTSTTLPDDRPIVWLFGDSVTGFYCPLVEQDHPEWNVRCMGRSGEVTCDGIARLDDALAASASPPAVVLIEEGVNDCVIASGSFDTSGGVLTCDLPNAFLPDFVASNLQAMANAARARGAAPLLATTLYACPVPSGETCMALPLDDPGACPFLRCFFDDVAQVNNLIIGGITPAVDFALTGDAFLDLLHPNPIGSAILASRAAQAIAAVLPPTPATDTGTSTH